MRETAAPVDGRPVVTIGEAMLRFSPPGCESLEQADTWQVSVGGAEANFAVALARLGVPVLWISKVPRNPLGRKLVGKIRQHGVDVSQVIWTEEGRLGLFFVEPGPLPDGWTVVYDRKGSAMSLLHPEEVDWRVVRASRLLHLTGITPALSQACLRVVERAVQEARGNGALVSFDVNYRAKLWSEEDAAATLSGLLSAVDLLIASKEDARILFGEGGDEEDVVRALHERFRPRVDVLTLGEAGAVAFDGTAVYRVHAYRTRVVDRIGRGDAFSAGFVYGYLHGGVERGLQYGNALAALAQTRPGDLVWVCEEDVRALLEGRVRGVSR
jgi:2-dehydro-3-deoxygluconokinase